MVCNRDIYLLLQHLIKHHMGTWACDFWEIGCVWTLITKGKLIDNHRSEKHFTKPSERLSFCFQLQCVAYGLKIDHFLSFVGKDSLCQAFASTNQLVSCSVQNSGVSYTKSHWNAFNVIDRCKLLSMKPLPCEYNPSSCTFRDKCSPVSCMCL